MQFLLYSFQTKLFHTAVSVDDLSFHREVALPAFGEEILVQTLTLLQSGLLCATKFLVRAARLWLHGGTALRTGLSASRIEIKASRCLVLI